MFCVRVLSISGKTTPVEKVERKRKNMKKCTKKRYLDKRQAKKALKRLRCKGLKRWYLCPICTGESQENIYHLTSQTKRVAEVYKETHKNF